MIVVFVLLALLAGGALVYLLRMPQTDVLDRVAALDKASGVDSDSRSLIEKLMDERRKHALSAQLLEAGWTNVTPRDMLLRSVMGFCAGAGFCLLLMLLLARVMNVMNVGVMLFVLFVAVYGAYWPFAQLQNAIKLRKSSIRRALPDFLDVLSTTVDAGVALNAALNAANEHLQGALREEMDSALQDIRLGRSRADALLAMAQRVRESDLTSVVVAIVQAERLGTGISEVLMHLATDTREKRFAHAEELATQLPNKLVFPVGLCMMPALLLMIFGAVIAKLLQ